jgi:transmembrane sensor
MKLENNKIDAELIGKYLAGEASPDEAMMLDEWLADPENKKEFDRYAKLWHLVNPSTEPQVSGEQAWPELQNAITTSRKVLPARRRLIYLGVAASIASLILVTYYLFQKGATPGTSWAPEIAVITTEARGEKITDTLRDGSTFTMNKSSSISYPKQFNVQSREVVLSGEAFFNVKPDKTKPFIITIDDLKIEVIGTSFNVRELPSAGSIEVQVQSGVVKMYTSEKQLLITKGQTGIYIKAKHELRLKDTIDLNSISYATNSFYFNDITLEAASRYLEEAFGVEIEIGEAKTAQCRFTAQFDNKSLAYILEVINATINTTHTQEGNTISITGNGCQ